MQEVLRRMMPLGGWSLNGDVVTIHEDGLLHGYAVPTPEEVLAVEAEIESESYRVKRAEAYPAIGDQLDAIWKEIEPNGIDAQSIKSQILQVKADYPKPVFE